MASECVICGSDKNVVASPPAKNFASARNALISSFNPPQLDSQDAADADKGVQPLPTTTSTVLTGLRGARHPCGFIVPRRDAGAASGPTGPLLTADPCAAGGRSRPTASPTLNASGASWYASTDILRSTEQPISRDAFTTIKPQIWKSGESLVLSAEEPRQASQTPRVADSSFSLYLARSVAERQSAEMEDKEEEEEEEEEDEEEKEGGKGKTLLGKSQFNKREAQCSGLGDLPPCSQFSLELRAYVQKIVSYTRGLRGAFRDHKGIFSPAEESEIWELLGGIEEGTESLRCISHDTQLQAYISTTEKVVVRSKRFEKRLIRLTQEKEAIVDARRDELQRMSHELQEERAAVKSVLLHLSKSEKTAGRTAQRSPEAPELGSDLDLLMRESEWSFGGAVGMLRDAEVTMRQSGISPPRNDVNSDTVSLVPFPLTGSADERRQWICDNALGYFSSCKEPTTPECVCAMIARVEPHDMANTLLQCKRQMSIVSNNLISRCPAALSFHYSVLVKRMDMLHKKWMQLEDEWVAKKNCLLHQSFELF